MTVEKCYLGIMVLLNLLVIPGVEIVLYGTQTNFSPPSSNLRFTVVLMLAFSAFKLANPQMKQQNIPATAE